MLKRDITYTDFDGNTVTESHYFNLMKSEIIELNVSQEGGMTDFIQRIINSKDQKAIVEEFKKIILITYGKRSEDGKRFIKNDELREEFSQSLAFDQLFVELASDDAAAALFLTGVLPADMQAEAGRSMEAARVDPEISQTLEQLPPPPVASEGEGESAL